MTRILVLDIHHSLQIVGISDPENGRVEMGQAIAPRSPRSIPLPDSIDEKLDGDSGKMVLAVASLMAIAS